MTATPRGQNVIPFGKYRGQPIEVLEADPQYAKWLAGQGWFRSHHQNLHAIIINNFQEPSETPEHNALQALFLGETIQRAFVSLVANSWMNKLVEGFQNDLQREIKIVDHEIRKGIEYVKELKKPPSPPKPGNSIGMEVNTFSEKAQKRRIRENEIRAQELVDYKKSLFQQLDQGRTFSISVEFEERGCDVFLAVSATDNREYSKEFRIEIKPTVGDDYPAVLRQMKSNRSNFLFLTEYTGQGATEEQFIQIFSASRIQVVFKHQVDELIQ